MSGGSGFFGNWGGVPARKPEDTPTDHAITAQAQASSGVSEECQRQLDYIVDAAQTLKTIKVPVSDEDLIAEIRANCPPDLLRRVTFDGSNERGAIG